MFWRVVFEGAVFEYDKEPVYKVDDLYADVAQKIGLGVAAFYLVYTGTDTTLQKGGTMVSNGILNGSTIQAVRQNTGGC